MASPARRRKTSPARRSRDAGAGSRRNPQSEIVEGYAPAQMIEDLRKYQAELEIQNKALRYSQQEAEGASERFATLFSNVPLSLMVIDEDGLIMASNAMALRLFQPLESDPPLNFLLPFVHANHADEVAVACITAKTEGTSEVTEVQFLAGSNGSFTGDLHIARIENPQDELAHFICAVIDQGPLLAQRQALQASAAVLRQRNDDLLTSENRMAAIINSALDAIVCVDENQCITIFNPAATQLFDCPADTAMGSPLARFLPDVHKALASGQIPLQSVLGEFAASTLRGRQLVVEISVSLERRVRRSPHAALTTIFARDVSARKQAEAQRLALETQMREAQKMQAMGTMAGGIAHDFNNILSAILGNVDLAKQDFAADTPGWTSLLEIEKAGRRARDLVRQILTFSRNEAPRRVPIRLAEVVRETEQLIKVTLPPSVDLRLSVQDDDLPVLADATQVEQALLNLCTNAILAIGKNKGTVRIDLTRADVNAALGGRLGLPAGAYMALNVSDNGEGMTPATLERIFEPFFTTRQVGEGTGLGLSVVHGVMQSHQGGIDVSSTPGLGSAFTLYFPLTGHLPEPSLPGPAFAGAIQGLGRHVMYVDDDAALVFLVQRVLQRKGFVVTTHTDPHQAEAALRAAPDTFDLLVTDYNMPGYSGLDLLRAAKAIRKNLPVALASGYVTAEIEQSALREGASALIYKPNDVNELCETVQRLIVGELVG
jgi:PAS domain S-box-containing protein